jgi:hypothetical protein
MDDLDNYQQILKQFSHRKINLLIVKKHNIVVLSSVSSISLSSNAYLTELRQTGALQ